LAIKYDRSGRSSGVAIISFETPTEATRAKKQFDGILAKGQPMSIVYDTMIPHAVRMTRRASAPPSSLIDRVQKPPLLNRLSRDDTSVKTPTGPRGGVGPIRSHPRGGAAPRAPRPGPKKPKTADELDKELDAFMGDGSKDEEAAALPQEAAQVEADVDMA